MSTDTIQHFATGVWSLRYVLLFVAFLAATAFALEYRRKWQDAAGLVKVYVDELRLADAYGKALEDRLGVSYEPVDAEEDDPLFSEGYVYDRIPTWVPADVPGAERGQR